MLELNGASETWWGTESRKVGQGRPSHIGCIENGTWHLRAILPFGWKAKQTKRQKGYQWKWQNRKLHGPSLHRNTKMVSEMTYWEV